MSSELVALDLHTQNSEECDPFAFHRLPRIFVCLNSDTHP